MHGGINETLMVQQKSQAKCVSHVVFILKHCCAGNALLILSSSPNYVSVRLFECMGGCLEAGCTLGCLSGTRLGQGPIEGFLTLYFISFLVSQWSLGQTMLCTGSGSLNSVLWARPCSPLLMQVLQLVIFLQREEQGPPSGRT